MVGGGGGEGSVNYAQYIMTCFEKAWNPPSELENDEALVETQVVIQRNGRFLLKKITKRCGIPALDKSVERALDAVPFVRPFPEGAQDLERTFNIEFNLKAKRRIG
jgi:TonB family protein